MKKIFSIAISLALLLALSITSLAAAAVLPAHIAFTTDAPCAVTVLVSSYTNPANQSGATANGSTPWALDTYPSTSVTFYYPAFVVCGGATYNFVSAEPGSPMSMGTEDSTTTVVGHYTLPVSDTTPPVWTVPASLSAEATGPTGAVVTYNASASDPDDAVQSQSCLPASGTEFPLGTMVVNCTATDTHGNTGTAQFDVTVVDTTPPALTLPGNLTVNAENASGAVVNFTASANDVVDGSVAVSCTPESGSLFPFGTTTVTCIATDTHGNTGTAQFEVRVVDTTPPTLSLPGDLTVTAENASGAVVNFTASASDLVDGSIAVSCTPASGSLFPLGATVVNCSATDSHSNTSSATFTVSVRYATGVNCGGVAGHQILRPINSDGSSVFKQGSVVPVKFRVCTANGDIITTSGVVTSFRLDQIIDGGVVSNVDQAILSATSDLDFRIGNKQWIFNLGTKNLAAGNTYVYLITLNDGSTIQFQFSLK